MDVSSLPRVPMLAALVACSTLSATDAFAATFTVGTGSGCTHATLAAAITAAENSAGADTIRLTRSITYSQVAATITTAQELTITGGFDTCTQATSDGIATVLDGAGGSAAPVLRINGNTGSLVRLDALTIRGGDVGGTGYGGGIYSRGNGILEIQRSTITQNTAGYGGGIYAEGTSDRAELVIGANVYVNANTARYSGGGVYIEGVEMTMVDPGSTIAYNEARGVFNPSTSQYEGGYGGGLQILGSDRDTYAYIGSPGPGGIGAIYSNTARHGGGVSIIANDEGALLKLFGTSPTLRTSINQNLATVSGGGIYAWSDNHLGGFVIGWYARAFLYNADITGNAAPTGSAVHLAPTPGFVPSGFAALIVNPVEPIHPSALACPVGAPCASISDNVDEGETGPATGGPVIRVDSDNDVDLRRVSIDGNRGGSLVHADDAALKALDTLWADNAVSGPLLRFTDGSDATIESSTIAGNTIGATQVIAANGALRLRRSILWQPGKTSATHSDGVLSATNVLTSERGSLDGGNTPYVTDLAPRFVDPARGDYRLRAASHAVDFASTGGGDDLLGHPRALDLPFKADTMGTADLGAFELQTLLPIVLNGDFDRDMNLWTQVTPGSSWVSDQNASGATGSGSILVNATNVSPPRFVARAQCVHLPGPGRYLLNGYGRSSGTTIANRDSTLLHWELRHAGTEACNSGTPNASGDHFLGASSSWRRPDTPAVIDLTPAQWTNMSSLTVYLVVNDNGVVAPPNNSAVGWFDGITLEVEDGDIIFQDDFDP